VNKSKDIIVGIIITSVIIATISTMSYYVLIYNKLDCDECQYSDINNNIKFKWDNITFTLINRTQYSVYNLSYKNLLIEISSSTCSDCIRQSYVINDFYNNLSSSNIDLTILTLLIDVHTEKELLDYCITYNLCWLIGDITESNYLKLNLKWIPTFYLFNVSKVLVAEHENNMNYEQLYDFVMSNI